ncbi:MAG: sigma-70 family RNA polymerase sigma factor [Rhodocyclales bacterium GT-UBC]|nr:MAG: sigma-70 family RNA polymerase sigma factor [Rhodocyclales bacterium GT-UBC]
MSPLMRMAVIAGVETAVRLHIRRGDNLDARDGGGATPLMLAAGRKKKGVVVLLLSAGADPLLTDPSGLDAIGHAERSGATECADLIRAALASVPVNCPSAKAEGKTVGSTGPDDRPPEGTYFSQNGLETVGGLVSAAAVECGETGALARKILSFPEASSGHTADESPETMQRVEEADLNVNTESGPTTVGVADLSGLDGLDDEPCFGGWEPEEESAPPEGNTAVADEVRAVHEAIGRHKAVDSDEDWGDVVAFLPERALPLVREDGEGPGVRSLLLRALREGSIPESSLVEVCREADGSQNKEAERLLAFVLGDLGASIDERDESDGAPYEPGETFAEEPVLSEAMAYAEDLASGRNESLRLYLRGFKGGLLEAEEELALGRAMEEAGEAALDALAGWPAGITAIVDAGRRVACGEADVESFSSGPEPSENGGLAPQVSEFDSDDDALELDRESLAFVAAVGEIEASAGKKVRLRAALAAANLSRGFLLELAKDAGGQGAGLDFAAAVTRQAAARERMILSNLRLAFSLAKKYMRSGEPLEDLVQEGNIGLMKAVERYDWRKGFRFSTYATWWIRQQISRAIADKSRTIRIPVHMHETVRRTERERDEFEARAGRPEKLEETARRMGLPVWKTRRILKLSEGTASLDEPDAETGLPVCDGLPGPESGDPCLRVEAASLRSTLMGMIGELKEREGEVITLRFGLGDEDPMTLEEVGQRFDVTRERIRQIEAKAIGRLSHSTRKEILAVYMNEGRGIKGGKLAPSPAGGAQKDAASDSETDDGT